MIGIIALFILVISFVVVHSIAYRFSVDFSNNNNPKLRKRLYWSAIGFLVFILVGDEIIGGMQMAYFCLSETKLEILDDELENRTVRAESTIFSQKNTILDVRKSIRSYMDINTGKVIIKGYRFKSDGGWLSRVISFNENQAPILFDDSCSTNEEFKRLRLKNNMKYLRH